MLRRPPRSTRTDTLFPYTTLFRSVLGDELAGDEGGALRISDDGVADPRRVAGTMEHLGAELGGQRRRGLDVVGGEGDESVRPATVAVRERLHLGDNSYHNIRRPRPGIRPHQPAHDLIQVDVIAGAHPPRAPPARQGINPKQPQL